MRVHPGIRIDQIRSEGMGGLIFTLGMVSVLLLSAPALRSMALVSLLGGLALAPVVYRLHRP